MAKLKNNQGISIIELLVALGIFAMVMSITINIFTAELKVQRKNLAYQAIQDDARYALEKMSREIRMSHIETNDGSRDQLEITAFKAGESQNVIYSLSSGRILRNSDAITSQKVNISKLKFYIDNKNQPPATVTIVITAEVEGEKSEQRAKMNLQTTLSARDYEE